MPSALERPQHLAGHEQAGIALRRRAAHIEPLLWERSGLCGQDMALNCHSVRLQGTVVTAGRARCVVIGTGTSTAIGKIHDAMTDAVCPELRHLI